MTLALMLKTVELRLCSSLLFQKEEMLELRWGIESKY